MGSFVNSSDMDYYKFVKNSAGRVSIFGITRLLPDKSSNLSELSICLLDSSGKELSKSTIAAVNAEMDAQKIEAELSKGTYYMVVKRTNPKKTDVSLDEYMVITIED